MFVLSFSTCFYSILLLLFQQTVKKIAKCDLLIQIGTWRHQLRASNIFIIINNIDDNKKFLKEVFYYNFVTISSV